MVCFYDFSWLCFHSETLHWLKVRCQLEIQDGNPKQIFAFNVSGHFRGNIVGLGPMHLNSSYTLHSNLTYNDYFLSGWG